MCQLCSIAPLAASHKWPKPLETSIKDADFLVKTAHDAYTNFTTSLPTATAGFQNRPPPPESLLDTLRTLSALLETLEEDRITWWLSPEKKAMRKRLEEGGKTDDLTKLQKINNATSERIGAMEAKLGGFVKWSLGMNGGLWELREGGKVNGGKEQEEKLYE